MNKKEISELRRRFNPDKNGISCLRGCYVNEKKEIIASFNTSLLLMPQEEAESYLSIFKKTLSGAPGRNLTDIAFSTAQVADSDEHRLLSSLKSSALKDDEAVQTFFDKVISSLAFEGNYLILLMADAYDLPSRSRDGGRLEDSMQTFSYIMCSVCPVKPTGSGLSYRPDESMFRTRRPDSLVGSPELGFIFPAFDGRATNIYGALYYTHDTAQNHSDFTDALFNVPLPMPAAEVRDTFRAVLEESVADACSYDVVQTVNDQLRDMIAAHEELKEDEPLTVTCREVKSLLESCGVPEENAADFEKRYGEEFGENTDLMPEVIIDTKQLELRTPDVVVKVTPDRGDLIETRVLNGIKYLLIRADEGVEVNGVAINIKDE